MEIVISGGAGSVTVSKMQTTHTIPFREKDKAIITIDLMGMTKKDFIKMILGKKKK